MCRDSSGSPTRSRASGICGRSAGKVAGGTRLNPLHADRSLPDYMLQARRTASLTGAGSMPTRYFAKRDLTPKAGAKGHRMSRLCPDRDAAIIERDEPMIELY